MSTKTHSVGKRPLIERLIEDLSSDDPRSRNEAELLLERCPSHILTSKLLPILGESSNRNHSSAIARLLLKNGDERAIEALYSYFSREEADFFDFLQRVNDVPNNLPEANASIRKGKVVSIFSNRKRSFY